MSLLLMNVGSFFVGVVGGTNRLLLETSDALLLEDSNGLALE